MLSAAKHLTPRGGGVTLSAAKHLTPRDGGVMLSEAKHLTPRGGPRFRRRVSVSPPASHFRHSTIPSARSASSNCDTLFGL
jgi:hypothetical protein